VEELVSDGETGLVVPPGDVDALARAIDRLADMPPEARAKMGRRGRAVVEAEFDIDAQAAHLAGLLRVGL
jgi:glycosyltransferase involved in cell wall biosynthesis